MDQQLLNDEVAATTDPVCVELGTVSEETKGGIMGWADGGIGHCFC